MSDFLSNNKLIIAFAAVVIAGAIWYGFSYAGSSREAVLGTEKVVAALNDEDQDIVKNLLILRSVDLNGTILSSKAFLGLQDFGTEITQEPVGRPDPFAPLSASVQVPATPASQTGSGGARTVTNPLD